jgi:hypothetical protein
MEGGDAEQSQSEWMCENIQMCGSCEQPAPCACSASEAGSEEEEVPEMVRTQAVACKAPREISLNALWNNDPVDDSPDLEGYFSLFGTDAWDRIRLCRTYANYLAASCPRAPKRARK